MLEIKHFDSQDSLHEFLRNDLESIYLDSLTGFNIAICGGSTPLPFYEYMRTHTITQASKLMKVFWTDERFVPIDDEWSNCYMPITQWFVKEMNVKCFPVNTDLDSPQLAADDYSKTLKLHTDYKLDYVILGMGTDGHIASIFPKQQPSDHLVFSCRHPSDKTHRVSMNYRLLASAKKIVLLIKGVNKRKTLENKEAKLPVHQLLELKNIMCLYID